MDRDTWHPAMEIEVLRAAKELIADKDHWLWGSSRVESPGGIRRCASAALHEARLSWLASHQYNKHLSIQVLGSWRLDEAAKTLHDQDIVGVNDSLGFDAVHEVYDYAIKMAESELEA